MASATETEVIDQILDEVPGLGWKFLATTSSAGAVVVTLDPEINKMGAQALDNRLAGLFLYIPSATGADIVHSTTTLAVSGAQTTITTLGTYGSTYTSVAHYLLAIHPDVLRRLINDALEVELTDSYIPLAHGPDDHHMQDANTTSWPDTSGVTVTLNTTAAEVFMGVRGKKAVYSAAGYSQSTLTNVTPGDPVLIWGIWKADIGTSSLQLVDAAGNVLDTIAATNEQFVLGFKTVTIPSTVYQVRLRLVGAANLDEGDWSAACIVRPYNRRFNLPSWVDERFKLRGLARLNDFDSSYDADTYEAYDFEELSLQEGEDFRFIGRGGDANPYQVVLARERNDLLSRPLFVIGQRPYSDFGTFSGPATTTTCPMHVLIPRCKWLLGDRYDAFEGEKTKAEPMLATRAAARMTRAPKPEIRVRRMFS